MTLEEVEKMGVDPTELMKKTNLTALLVDVINTISIELEQDFKKLNIYRHELKRDANKLKNYSSKMVESADKMIGNDDVCMDFSDDSEYLYEVLKVLMDKKNHTQVLSVIKLVK